MPIAVNCPNPACAHTSRAADTAVGKTTKCSRCGRAFVVPPSATATAVKPTTDDASPKLTKPATVTATAIAFQHVGRFVVRAKVGEGAFGAVYRAYDPHLDREVALKVPHAAVLDSPKRVERFLREAKAAANLRHPHIVPVFDAGTDAGRHYIAAAFIDGTKLADAVEASDGGLDCDRAARLVRELAEALAYAHQEGIVHRDVKPDNVMLDQADRVHLMDFGLASKQDEEAKLTRDGAVMGTPSYMAPEQARGDTAAVGPAADQYACGVVLYELLTGKVPFTGPLPVVMHHHIHTDPTPAKLLRRAIPKDLETICLKALRKNPAERYADCQALADDLRRWQEGEPVSARRRSVFVHLFRWMQQHATQAAMIVAGTTLVLILLGVMFLAGIQQDASRARLDKAEAEKLLMTAEQRANDAADVRIRSAESKADERVREAQARADERVKEALAIAEERTREVKAIADEKANEAKAKADEVRRKLEEAEKDDSLLAEAEKNLKAGNSSEAKRLLARVSEGHRQGEWKRLRSELNPVTNLVGHTSSVYAVAFSTDGNTVVTGSTDDTARIWDAESGKLLQTLVGHTNSVLAVGISRDGKRILTGSSDKTARIWDAESGKLLRTLTEHTSSVNAVAFSADGKWVLTGSGDKTARIWDAESGDLLRALMGHTSSVYAVAFSRDGKFVLTGSHDDTARIWDAESGDLLQPLVGHTNSVNAVAFSPDGKYALTGSSDKTGRIWNAGSGKFMQPLAGHTTPVNAVAFSPDGKYVLTGSSDGTARIWDAESGKTVRPLTGHTDLINAVAFSPDGKRVLTGSSDKSARIWDLELLEMQKVQPKR